MSELLTSASSGRAGGTAFCAAAGRASSSKTNPPTRRAIADIMHSPPAHDTPAGARCEAAQNPAARRRPGITLMPRSLLRAGMAAAEIREVASERQVMVAWRPLEKHHAGLGGLQLTIRRGTQHTRLQSLTTPSLLPNQANRRIWSLEVMLVAQ